MLLVNSFAYLFGTFSLVFVFVFGFAAKLSNSMFYVTLSLSNITKQKIIFAFKNMATGARIYTRVLMYANECSCVSVRMLVLFIVDHAVEEV